MNSTNRRRRDGVHLTTAQRKHVRNYLVKIHGSKCCWCDEEMVIPQSGKDISNYSEMATIEHHFAKLDDDPTNVKLYKLSHNRCNK